LGFSLEDKEMPSGQKRNTKIIDGVQYNQCTECEEWFKATKEFFTYRKDKNVLHAKCRICTRKRALEFSRKPDAKLKLKEYRVKNRTKIIKYLKDWRKDNPDYDREYRSKNEAKRTKQRKIWNENNKEHVQELTKNYMQSSASFDKYVAKLTIDEAAKPDGEGNLLVKCTYCGRYFIPTNREVLNRISVLGGGKNLYGEARLYCSNNCKEVCPVFGQQWYRKGDEHHSSREVDPLVRQMALKLDNYECQRCGKSIDEISLHVHHIQPYRKNLMLANDIDNTITFCIHCHLSWMHANSGYGCTDTKC
jgi:hypothetical protein